MMSDHIPAGRYTLVDFWASWCGPCRAAIPHVKKIHELYGHDALNIVSISVDQDGKEWEKAVEEEKMPWLQLIGGGEFLKLANEHYKLKSIPTLLIIDPQGNVRCSTNSTGVIDERLKKLIGDRF